MSPEAQAEADAEAANEGGSPAALSPEAQAEADAEAANEGGNPVAPSPAAQAEAEAEAANEGGGSGGSGACRNPKHRMSTVDAV